MAISIQNTPSSYTSVHGDVLFTVCDIVKASDPVTYKDYRYVCDVYIASTLVARLKAYPNPDNKCGVFNIGNILRAYISAAFNPTAASLRAQELGNGEFSISATCKFGDEYNFTLNTNITVDSARTYFNHYNGRLIGQTTNLSQFLDRPATTRTTYTAIVPSTIASSIYSGNKNNFISFFASNTNPVTLRIKSYTKDDILIDSKDQIYSPSALTEMEIYNLSPAVINNYFPGLINPDVISYYTISFISPFNIVLFRTIRFNLICESKFEVFTLHFLNKYGGFESRDFTKISRKTIDIEKSEFGKLGYTMDSSGVVSYRNSNNVYNETRSVYSSQYKEKLSLNSDILTDDEYTWLGELILSPMVFVEQVVSGTSYFLPCAITANNYEFRKSVNDSLTNLTIDIEFGEQFNSQYR